MQSFFPICDSNNHNPIYNEQRNNVQVNVCMFAIGFSVITQIEEGDESMLPFFPKDE